VSKTEKPAIVDPIIIKAEATPSEDSNGNGAPENPTLVFVKGGTSTTKNDQLWEARYQEAEKRRDEADFERKVAGVPVESGGGKLFSSQLTSHPDIPRAYILVKYLSSGGEDTGLDCLADLIVGMDESKPTELTLILVCPGCMSRGDKHMQDCQIQIRQSNKGFKLTTGKGDPTFVYEDEVYKSAGVISDMEAFSCPDCGMRARVDNNCLRPD
jgi:hypothetical protein